MFVNSKYSFLKWAIYDVVCKKQTQPKNKSRKRKIIWFNPPFNNYVANNIGKEFLKLITKHFPPQHRLHKILNRNSIKISYSCMPNMQTIITGHNKKLLEKKSSQQSKPCNCKNKDICPLKGSCRQKSIIYQADISHGNVTESYIGCSETEFKSRYYNHIQSFKNIKKRNATELSKTFWNAKESGLNPTINWKIINQVIPYKPGQKCCNLCLTEKLQILQAKQPTILNKRSELTGKCRHKNKFKLNKLPTWFRMLKLPLFFCMCAFLSVIKSACIFHCRSRHFLLTLLFHLMRFFSLFFISL